MEINLHYEWKIWYTETYIAFFFIFLLSRGEYFIGHPEVILRDFLPLENYKHGFCKVKILAPRNLWLPILPTRIGKPAKLIFALCQKCATTQNSKKCECSDDERAFTGCWVTAEVLYALKKGYRILKIYEVCAYDHWNKVYSMWTDGK